MAARIGDRKHFLLGLGVKTLCRTNPAGDARGAVLPHDLSRLLHLSEPAAQYGIVAGAHLGHIEIVRVPGAMPVLHQHHLVAQAARTAVNARADWRRTSPDEKR